MSTLLWHSEIRLPNGFVAPTGKVELEYTAHAAQACKDDRYGEIRQFKTLNLARFSVVEVETVNGDVTKLVIRGQYNDRYDVVLAVIPGNVYVVKTAWLNSRYDRHATLDARKYVAA